MIHLRGATTDVVLDDSHGVPVIVHWGAPLGDVAYDSVADALRRPVTHGMLDVIAPVAIVPEHGSGFPGRPGLVGHRRRGAAWSPRFRPAGSVPIEPSQVAGGERSAAGVVISAVDEVAALRVDVAVTLGHVLTVSATVTNTGEGIYLLDQLGVTLPLPAHASDLLTFSGRWTREFHQHQRAWPAGAVLIENRRGRTSHEHVSLAFAGDHGFGEWRGEVWGAHLAWSGNHSLLADCLADGRRYLQLGELLHPGEIALHPGQSYRTPDVIAVHSADGLTPATWGFHRSLRARPEHPRAPRPVLLNTWEAVYFDHDMERLQELATVAASLGIERYVLDDGWFGSRRDDRSGLGDWWVSPDVYPHGLGPLIEHVTSLGMEFGIWVEPEMVNADSEVFRAHPEWALVTPGYEPVEGRHQLLIDLGRPDAFAYILGHLDALLRDHEISFVKWDMNRDHVQGSGADGAAGTHAQTLALYALLDELQRRHPSVEIESCASGGGRIDHGILQRTSRVWTSDCNDALERQTIQRGASMLIPPELMGAHVGPARAHTTGRTHTLDFRVATAFFGHLGVECDVVSLDQRDREELAAAIALHQRFRALLHSGDVVRFDVVTNGPPTDSPVSFASGVYAPDRSEALVSVAQLRTGMSLTPPPLRLPGLDLDRRYAVTALAMPRAARGPAREQVGWMRHGITLTGRQLAVHGLQLPAMNPEAALLLHLHSPAATEP
jgi:alpha-galactosidase